MPYNKKVHHRRSIRLPGYDYASAGAYFVTICVRGGECLLGEVVDGEMHLNEWGQIAHTEWLASQEIRRELNLDAFVVMPNHLHGIVWITRADPVGAPNSAPTHAHNRETPVGAHGGAPNSAPNSAPNGAPNSAPKHAHNRETPVGAHGGAPNSAPNGAPLQRPPKSLGSFIAGYKTVVTTRINQLRDTPGLPFWQRNYWEHIVRDERSLKRIREYVENNPARWAEDQLHPDAPPNPFNRWTP